MSEPKRAGSTRAFYERYHFPGHRPVDQDGLIFLRHFSKALEQQCGDDARRPCRVLDAGCGTGNTSVSLARRFTDVSFLGIDRSRRSLALARGAARSEGLKNVRFRGWDLLVPLPPEDRYDIVLCLGVLHHTPDMARVLRNLRRALKRPGRLFLWIYGKHGRYNHTLNRRALAYLVATLPPRKALDVATAFVHDGGTGQALADLVGKVPVTTLQREAFESPVWIADQFLVPHEDLLDMEGLLALVQRTGFTVECDIGRHAVKEDWCSVPVLRDRLRRLPAREQLIVQDLLAKPERYFVILRPID